MASFMKPAPPPATPLGRHRPLAPQASVRVSPLCLGGMNFGNAWTDYMGECDKKTTHGILDYFFESGGNFIDTSGNYQSGQSEEWIGEWMEKRGNRDQMIIATKYTSNFQYHLGFDKRLNSTFGGNNVKSMHTSVEASLRKLKTSYIDILYVHWYDHLTGVEELMQGLNNLLHQGKVLYLGASDLPAFFVTKCNQYARDHGLRGFVVYQGMWSAANRDYEREIVPMATMEGMGHCPWNALGGGHFKTRAQREAMNQAGEKGRAMWRKNDRAIAVTDALEAVARRHGRGDQVTSIALAYVMHKTPYVFPIVGGRKIDHLRGNIDALTIRLTDADLAEIEAAADFDIGFPWSMVGQQAGEFWLTKAEGNFDFPERPRPIQAPTEGDNKSKK